MYQAKHESLIGRARRGGVELISETTSPDDTARLAGVLPYRKQRRSAQPPGSGRGLPQIVPLTAGGSRVEGFAMAANGAKHA